jgi:hypothetical protein
VIINRPPETVGGAIVLALLGEEFVRINALPHLRSHVLQPSQNPIDRVCALHAQSKQIEFDLPRHVVNAAYPLADQVFGGLQVARQVGLPAWAIKRLARIAEELAHDARTVGLSSDMAASLRCSWRSSKELDWPSGAVRVWIKGLTAHLQARPDGAGALALDIKQ